MKTFSVLLAGGAGTRLWPVSRELYPKQLIKFIGNRSLIQNTIQRLEPVLDKENIKVVCGTEHFHEIDRHMKDIGITHSDNIISEPLGRNTAPAILLALFDILSTENDAIVCIFPADHIIVNKERFQDKLKIALSLSEKGHIVTFGIEPSYPETEYGYIEAEGTISENAFSLKRFVEKPDRKTAWTYLKSGTFFWNSGMFVFKASVMLNEFATYQKHLFHKLQSFYKKWHSINKKKYASITNISIDYAIMEHTKKGVILPSDFGWSDIGSWKALYDFLPKDNDANVIEGDVIIKKTKRCFISGRERLIATSNINNMVIVETPDAILISDLENSRDVKSIVKDLKNKGRNEYINHPTISYTWGIKTELERKKEYVVNRIVIYPQATFEGDLSPSESGIFSMLKGEVLLKTLDSNVLLYQGDHVKINAEDNGLFKNEKDQSATLICAQLLKEDVQNYDRDKIK